MLAVPAVRPAEAAVPGHPASHQATAAGARADVRTAVLPDLRLGRRPTQAELMSVPSSEHDINWLKASLQSAIELEFSTIPPYLCALWSIEDESHPARLMIRDIVGQEMLHMGLACNMLTAIGGTPLINRPEVVPTYPGHLPGGVRPQVRVSLQALSKRMLRDVFMQIEYPEAGPINIVFGQTYSTIGTFYDAIAAAFHRLPDDRITGTRQILSREFKLWPITSRADAERAITEIKHQGEGTSQSPEQGTLDPELAHYYTFAQIYHGRRLMQGRDGRWSYSGAAIPFPRVFPVVEVPPEGYPQSRTFDLAFTALLGHLQAAWERGDQRELDAAIQNMKELTAYAHALVRTPLPHGRGNYGPAFRLVT